MTNLNSRHRLMMVSTPSSPDGLFATMEQEENSIYKRLTMDYRVGLGKIYSDQEIQAARKSPSFGREYECRYLGLIGNCFRPEDISYAVDVMGSSYNPSKFSRDSPKSLGIDPAWGGSSKFGLVVTEMTPKCINVLLAEEYGERPTHEDMLERVLEIMTTYRINKVYVDSSASSFISSLKEKLGERTDWVEEIKEIRSKYKWQGSEDYFEEWMTICPIVFSTEHKNLLARAKMIVESQGAIAISPRFQELIASLTSAVELEGALKKDRTAHNDILDSFRLSLWYYKKIERRRGIVKVPVTPTNTTIVKPK